MEINRLYIVCLTAIAVTKIYVTKKFDLLEVILVFFMLSNLEIKKKKKID